MMNLHTICSQGCTQGYAQEGHEELKHLHVLIKAEILEPKALALDELVHWVEDIIEGQRMEIVQGPFIEYVDDLGNEGPTGGCHIKTSHFAFHIWEEQNLIQMDLYTCGKLYVHKLLNNLKVFTPAKVEYMVIDREDGFKILEANTVEGGVL